MFLTVGKPRKADIITVLLKMIITGGRGLTLSIMDIRTEKSQSTAASRQKASDLKAETHGPGHCVRCLLREYDEEAYISKLLRVIRLMKPREKASEEETARRLGICKECDKLEMGTCLACGCYVELRSALKNGKCPYKKWQ